MGNQCNDKNFKNKITILVNSCDSYQDLWGPFFTLLKKYWNPIDVPIIFNTESLDFEFDGLNIICVHPEKQNYPYGKRMINALSYVKTEYVVLLLDDFFLREKVDEDKIKEIINWMDSDRDIVYFNCDITPVYSDWEKDKYIGYRRIPWGNEYTLNMQAAIWRTKKLKQYWLPDVSPWDWEEYSNLYGAVNRKDKFYCAHTLNGGFCNYGFRNDVGWAVVHGKWVIDDVQPLFEKENIKIDFSERGVYATSSENSNFMAFARRKSLIKRSCKSDIINRCIPKFKKKYKVFVKKNYVLQGVSLYCHMEDVFVNNLLLKKRKEWLAMQRRNNILKEFKNHGAFSVIKRVFMKNK